MSTILIKEKFVINDVLTNVTSVKLSDPTGTFGVKRNDTNEVIVDDNTSLSNTSTGIYQYEMTEPDGETNLTYTYWIEWIYDGETFREEKTVNGITSDLAPARVTSKYVQWIKDELAPLTLATPDPTIEQCIENAVRYWNTHSGYKIMTMVEYSQGQVRAQVSVEVKTVVQVYPSNTTTWIWNDHPLWSILGVTVLDNVTSDMMLMSQAFRDYRIFVGADFRWMFQKSEDPDVDGGFIYAMNVPSGIGGLCLVCTKRITATEDIKQEYILDWVLNYLKALVYMIEGNTLRKSGIVDIKNDGQELVDEGREDKLRLQEQLAKDSRWVVLSQRF